MDSSDMDLLVFDAKRNRHVAKVPVALNKEELSGMLGNKKIDAFMIGGLVQIFDEAASRIIFECAGIGQWMEDERKESRGVSRTCFSREETSTENIEISGVFEPFEEDDEAKSWAEQSPICNSLVLSPMEAVLLSIEWQVIDLKKGETSLTEQEIWTKMKYFDDNPNQFGKNYATYRYLKMNGWIVTSGITFGCNFLIYCLGAQFYHASAGVLISNTIEPQSLLTLTRILAHNKKALIVATTTGDVQEYEDVQRVEVNIVTMKTYFLERDVAQMSTRINEIYDLNCID